MIEVHLQQYITETSKKLIQEYEHIQPNIICICQSAKLLILLCTFYLEKEIWEIYESNIENKAN